MIKPLCSNFRVITAFVGCPNVKEFYGIYFSNPDQRSSLIRVYTTIPSASFGNSMLWKSHAVKF